MFRLIIFDNDSFYKSFANVISIVSQEDHNLCFSYVDALGCIITDVYHLGYNDYFKIEIVK